MTRACRQQIRRQFNELAADELRHWTLLLDEVVGSLPATSYRHLSASCPGAPELRKRRRIPSRWEESATPLRMTESVTPADQRLSAQHFCTDLLTLHRVG